MVWWMQLYDCKRGSVQCREEASWKLLFYKGTFLNFFHTVLAPLQRCNLVEETHWNAHTRIAYVAFTSASTVNTTPNLSKLVFA